MQGNMQMKSVVRNTVATLAFALMCVTAADAQSQAEPPQLAKQILPARGGNSTLRVTSAFFTSGDQIPERFTQNGENVSPPITWTKGPAGTISYVVLAEDNGVARPEPIVHWIVYDIPGTVTRLPLGVPSGDRLENGAAQGKNIAGTAGYVGPKPPAGETHPYHFQVFALTSRLNIDPATADRATILAAMKGKVITSGDLIGRYTGK
jgi:Raf kinase inhibitor-like YbhB/YbcL family protein